MYSHWVLVITSLWCILTSFVDAQLPISQTYPGYIQGDADNIYNTIHFSQTLACQKSICDNKSWNVRLIDYDRQDIESFTLTWYSYTVDGIYTTHTSHDSFSGVTPTVPEGSYIQFLGSTLAPNAKITSKLVIAIDLDPDVSEEYSIMLGSHSNRQTYDDMDRVVISPSKDKLNDDNINNKSYLYNILFHLGRYTATEAPTHLSIQLIGPAQFEIGADTSSPVCKMHKKLTGGVDSITPILSSHIYTTPSPDNTDDDDGTLVKPFNHVLLLQFPQATAWETNMMIQCDGVNIVQFTINNHDDEDNNNNNDGNDGNNDNNNDDDHIIPLYMSIHPYISSLLDTFQYPPSLIDLSSLDYNSMINISPIKPVQSPVIYIDNTNTQFVTVNYLVRLSNPDNPPTGLFIRAHIEPNNVTKPTARASVIHARFHNSTLSSSLLPKDSRMGQVIHALDRHSSTAPSSALLTSDGLTTSGLIELTNLQYTPLMSQNILITIVWYLDEDVAMDNVTFGSTDISVTSFTGTRYPFLLQSRGLIPGKSHVLFNYIQSAYSTIISDPTSNITINTLYPLSFTLSNFDIPQGKWSLLFPLSKYSLKRDLQGSPSCRFSFTYPIESPSAPVMINAISQMSVNSLSWNIDTIYTAFMNKSVTVSCIYTGIEPTIPYNIERENLLVSYDTTPFSPSLYTSESLYDEVILFSITPNTPSYNTNNLPLGLIGLTSSPQPDAIVGGRVGIVMIFVVIIIVLVLISLFSVLIGLLITRRQKHRHPPQAPQAVQAVQVQMIK